MEELAGPIRKRKALQEVRTPRAKDLKLENAPYVPIRNGLGERRGKGNRRYYWS